MTLPSSKVITNTFVSGLLDHTTQPEGTTNYAYGSCGSQIDTVTEGAESIAYTYDGTLLTGMTYQGELNQNITQRYNNDFLIDSLSYAGATTAISYDNDSLVTGIHGYTLGLNANNALPETVSDNTFVQTRGYNGYGEVTTTSTQVNNQSTYDYALTYNDLGQIVTKQETLHNGSVNNYVYTYDPDRRWLSTVTKNNILVENYAHDANGNRTLYTNTALNINGKVPTYNIADQLTSDGHIYDVDGYLTQKTINGVTTQYQYSSRGQLVSVQAPGTNITYQHNAMGNRVAKRVNGGITEKYLWQDKTTLLAVYNPDNSLKQRFEYTLGNTPTSFTQAGQKYYIVSDHLGSPRVITDSNGAVLKAYSFDAFGNRSTITDNNPTMEIPFGFAGGLYDTDTGLIRFGYRDYDSKTGRWTARDPIGLNGGDGDVYAYVFNDPVQLLDPIGLLAANHHFTTSYSAGVKSGMSILGAMAFAKNVVMVDKGTQSSSPKDTQHHVMVGDGQTVSEAAQMASDLIHNVNGEFSLAERAHALQDKAAPWHEGHGWNENTSILEKSKHLMKDLFPGDDVMQKASEYTTDLLEGRFNFCPTGS